MLASLDAPWISVVIPTYNEAPVIAATVASVAERLAEDGRPSEIVVVDNGSPDGTAAAVRALDIGNVRVLENGANRGKGYSVRRGMLDARGERGSCATPIACPRSRRSTTCSRRRARPTW